MALQHEAFTLYKTFKWFLGLTMFDDDHDDFEHELISSNFVEKQTRCENTFLIISYWCYYLSS